MSNWTHFTAVVSLYCDDLDPTGFKRFLPEEKKKNPGDIDVVDYHYMNARRFFENFFAPDAETEPESFAPVLSLSDGTEVKVPLPPHGITCPFRGLHKHGGLTFNIAYNHRETYGSNIVLTYVGSIDGGLYTMERDVNEWFDAMDALFHLRCASLVITDSEGTFAKKPFGKEPDFRLTITRGVL